MPETLQTRTQALARSAARRRMAQRMYTGGSRRFNERTGQYRDRFQRLGRGPARGARRLSEMRQRQAISRR